MKIKSWFIIGVVTLTVTMQVFALDKKSKVAKTDGESDLIVFCSPYKESSHLFRSPIERKELVTVIFDKNTLDKKEIDDKVKQVTKYFFDHGFKRVVIKQAVCDDVEYPIYSDQRNPNENPK